MKPNPSPFPNPSPYINETKKTIQFHLKMGAASQVSVCGTFNHWAKDELSMEHIKDDDWLIEIPMLPHGKYYYRFMIDDKMWMEDIENPLREPDGTVGFYSVLTV